MAEAVADGVLTPEVVFRDYAPRVYNLARRMLGNDADAEDVTQDVLLQVVRKLDTFRGEAAFPTWLHRVTVNAALATRRKRARRDEGRVYDPLDAFADDGHHASHVRPWPKLPEGQALDKEQQQMIESAITTLPDLYRDVFVLADVEQLPNAEIADMLELSLPAVKSRLHRARLMMRDALSRHFEEPLFMTLTCRKVAELLIDYVEGSLAEEDRDYLQRHLCGCVPCAIYMHTYSTIRVTKELPDVPLPAEFAARLMAALKAEQPPT